MGESKILYKTMKIIYSILLKIIYNPIVIGKENIPKEGACILVGNHIHAYDAILVMAQTNRIVHYFAKKEIFRGIYGKFFEKMGLIKVDRQNGKSYAMLSGIKRLKQGQVIGIFPEGTRNKTSNNILKFKKGAVIMAMKTCSPIIPFAIIGEYKPFRKRLQIVIEKPININNIEIEKANEYLQNTIVEIINRNKERKI